MKFIVRSLSISLFFVLTLACGGSKGNSSDHAVSPLTEPSPVAPPVVPHVEPLNFQGSCVTYTNGEELSTNAEYLEMLRTVIAGDDAEANTRLEEGARRAAITCGGL